MAKTYEVKIYEQGKTNPISAGAINCAENKIIGAVKKQAKRAGVQKGYAIFNVMGENKTTKISIG